MTLKIFAWSPSKWAGWKQCPFQTKCKDVLKMCPVCFRGKVSGGFDGEPVKCDTCNDPQPEREALDRGNMLDAALTTLVSKKKVKVPEGTKIGVTEEKQPMAVATRHPAIRKLVVALRKARGVLTQPLITIARDWTVRHEDPPKKVFARDAWGRVKLDVLKITGDKAEIIDWKSGNIDKIKGEIKEKDEYHDSMRAYQLVVLSVNPKLKEARARMAFIDAPPKLSDPFKEPHTGVLLRKDLPEAQRAWEKKVEPMLSDTVFAPRPGYYCDWCSFSKRKGGPCPY